MPLLVSRVLAMMLVAACASLALARPAPAFSPRDARAAADRASAAWMRLQHPGGAFTDPVSGRESAGYGNVMIGYGLLRAGERSGDARVVAAGVRAVDAGIRRAPAERGVFDALAAATAYSFARRSLADDPAFRAARPRWEEYLRGFVAPNVSEKLRACVASPGCFHNHEVVGAFADLRLLGTGVRSDVPGTQLASPDALRTAALDVIGVGVPAATGGGEFGLLSDTGSWPLAYHAFSTAMLAGAVGEAAGDAPAASRAALARAVRTLGALMAPDGDVAYIGRRQQQGWALASSMLAAATARRLGGLGLGDGAVEAVGDRAFARLRAMNRFGPGGLGAVPRELTRAGGGYRGVDANQIVSSSLEIFLLNLAADEEERAGEGHAGALPADADGSFLRPAQAGFAAVRRGDIWFAVHRRPHGADRRYDFGLVALKQRVGDGGWRDLIRPRPLTRGLTADSAGPVIVAAGRRWLPWGERIGVARGGVVLVRGGWRAQDGTWLRRGVTFRFAPVAGGVALAFPLRRGDKARLTTFLPRSGAGHSGRSVFDDASVASLSVAPDDVRLKPGLASCCDADLVAATMQVQARRDGPVSYTVRAREAGGGDAGTDGSGDSSGAGGGVPAWAVALLALAALAGAAVLLRVLALRRRRRRRAEARARRRR